MGYFCKACEETLLDYNSAFYDIIPSKLALKLSNVGLENLHLLLDVWLFDQQATIKKHLQPLLLIDFFFYPLLYSFCNPPNSPWTYKHWRPHGSLRIPYQISRWKRERKMHRRVDSAIPPLDGNTSLSQILHIVRLHSKVYVSLMFTDNISSNRTLYWD